MLFPWKPGRLQVTRWEFMGNQADIDSGHSCPNQGYKHFSNSHKAA